jgi:formamidopyrimidine-DNA glycosylase
MPELPEVEVIGRHLATVVTGRVVREAWGHPSPKFETASGAVGARIGAVRRRGKYLLADLDDDRELVLHFGMTGAIHLDLDPAADRHAHARAEWLLDDGTLVSLRDARQFGRAVVVPTGDYTALPTLARLGPEPFDGAFTDRGFAAALGARRAPVKAVLLDQRAVAGVGNWSADEALWRARIHPARRRVGAASAARLRRALIDVLTEAIDHGGTTLRDYRQADGSRGSHQDHLDCYGRLGQPCRRCGSELRATVVAGRTTTYCPRCQR